MKTLYLWVAGTGRTPFQYNELSELASEFEARNIKLGDGCQLGNWCKLGDGCQLGNWCDVPKSLFVSASRHTVSYWGEDVIQIGCKRYTISEWQKHFQKIGEAEGYSPEQIEEYKGYIDLIATMHKTWKVEKVKDK